MSVYRRCILFWRLSAFPFLLIGGTHCGLGWSCPSACPIDSTREPPIGFGLNLTWRLCCCARPQNCTFMFPVSYGNNMADEENREVSKKPLAYVYSSMDYNF